MVTQPEQTHTYYIKPVQTVQGLKYRPHWNEAPDYPPVQPVLFGSALAAQKYMQDHHSTAMFVPHPTLPNATAQVPMHLPYSPASPTSARAAEAAAYNAPSQRGRIMQALAAHPSGLTAEQLSDLLGSPLNSISTRCSQLRNDGIVRIDGTAKTRASGYALDANRYVLVPEAERTHKPEPPRPHRNEVLRRLGNDLATILGSMIDHGAVDPDDEHAVARAEEALIAWHGAT